jgi:hypothetical protein
VRFGPMRNVPVQFVTLFPKLQAPGMATHAYRTTMQ